MNHPTILTATENDTDLDGALAHANIPTLLMVLFQLTGDETWLRDPYKPSTTRGLSDNDEGGLSQNRQTEVRAAAAEAVHAFWSGKEPVIASPDVATIQRMYSVCMGEPVSVEYAEMISEEFVATEPAAPSNVSAGTRSAETAIIIGAGIYGLTAALKLRETGVDVRIFEKNSSVGGTWFENRYPGAGVDTPSYLYSWSFYQKDWAAHFGKQAEVLQYVRDMADHFDLTSAITFESEVSDAVFDAESAEWMVTVRGADGKTTQAKATILITGVGLHSRPQIPDLPGLADFTGQVFHSATWPADIDLAGKRVAVVGTGASSMQLVPAIVDTAAEVIVVQRTAQWVAPCENYFQPIAPEIHWLMKEVPFYQQWYRARLAWTWNDKVHPTLEIDPTWDHPERSLNKHNDRHRDFFTAYMREKLAGRPDLQAKALPTYPPFGKRMLLDNGWFDALKRPQVELLTDTVTSFTETGIVTAGGEVREVDIVVMCTGFQVQRVLHPMNIVGRDGVTIREVWGDDNPTAYLGMSSPGFPNLFYLYGPNTNSGAGGSAIFIAECQSRYLVGLIKGMRARNAQAIEPRQSVHDEYNERMDRAHSTRIWSHPGMKTYYRNSRGRVVVNFPWRIVDYWTMTHEVDMSEYELTTQ